MMRQLNVVTTLNRTLACPFCDVGGTWRQTRKDRRENSIVHWLECTKCHRGVVAKLPLLPGSSRGDRRRAESEHHVLADLQARFPQDQEYGTLVPVAYLDEFGLLVTQRFDGYNLMQHLGSSSHTEPLERCHGAGAWLRRLHDAFPDGPGEGLIGVSDKLEYLERSYGTLLANNQVARDAYQRLVETGNQLKTPMFRSSWSHGDFKPENILYGGCKYVGLDMLLQYRSAVAYDLASFLNHFLLAARTLRYRRVQGLYEQAEEQLLSGYRDLNGLDRYAIRWLQSYFMLHYWARSQGRGRLRALYGNWQMLPLLRSVGPRA